MKKTAVIALGGNAILRREDKASVDAQFENVKKAAHNIAKLSKKYRLVLTHGNGPQVGNIMLRSEQSSAYKIPLYVAVAESEGEIGYVIQQVLQNTLKETVVSLLTQVLVEKKDCAFRNPTKPVGPFYTKKEAMHLAKQGMIIRKVDHGFRRVVASPAPIKIIEASAIRELASSGFIVIAAGGGGIPVFMKSGKLQGVDAVIDKDLAAACLAKDVKADLLFLLTDVSCVYLNYGTKKQKPVKRLTAKTAQFYLNHKQFPAGSMGPKVQAAINFLSNNRKGKVIIGNINNPEKGTVIVI